VKYNNIMKLVLIVILIGLGAFTFYRYMLTGKFDYVSVSKFINSYGSFAALIFIAIFSIRTLLVIFPYSILVILGGSIFGPVNGFIYSMVSVFISATLAFFTSRFLGKSHIQRLLKGKVKRLDSQIERHGFKFIFLVRVSVIFPFDVLNYAAGLTKVKYNSFILGTVLGIIPETFSLTYLGHSIKAPLSTSFLLSLLLVLATVMIPLFFKKSKMSSIKFNIL
jgi:uncharacterized membrane protein YdjX (TVP38/TMEM64 family)